MISEKAATVLATMGTVCWCVQLIPQIWYNYRRKNCEGFPPIMMFLWAFCGVPFSIYFISTRANIVVQIQPQLFYVFCLTAWCQALYYPPVKASTRKIIVLVGGFVIASAALEGGFISYLRPLYDKGTKWPTLIFGIIASVLLAAGLVPPYLELLKRRGRVVGIHFAFLAVDMAGAILSALSVAVGNMDVMGIILYSVCAAMEIGIFTSHFIWWCRFRWLGTGELDDEEKNIADDTQLSNISNYENEGEEEEELHDTVATEKKTTELEGVQEPTDLVTSTTTHSIK